MAGKCVSHDRVPWVSGIVRKISDRSYAIDMVCVRCYAREHRRFCCFDKAKSLGLECFARMHFACAEVAEKEKLV